MKRNSFSSVKMDRRNPKWLYATKRYRPLYKRENEIRSEFTRDYNRILHCTAYRRLKHKTQVFFATQNDHICTRIEHVNYVTSVSYSISNYLGLNTELTSAIAIGHDLGHAPFGHAGEMILKQIAKRELKENFWHEKNSLRFVDQLETLPDPYGREYNLNLTYAVRDGIILHCGEVDEGRISPRKKILDLENIKKPGQYSPYTWEGCVVKIADKISYLGRDIEDALRLKIISPFRIRELHGILKRVADIRIKELNTTGLMHNFIWNLCETSSPKSGIQFSDSHLRFIKSLKDYCYKEIYNHKRISMYKEYAKLVINSIFKALKSFYKNENTLRVIQGEKKLYPILLSQFEEWLLKYSNLRVNPILRASLIRKDAKIVLFRKYENMVVYDILNRKDYLQAVVDFISGMTDSFAIRVFTELTSFY